MDGNQQTRAVGFDADTRVHEAASGLEAVLQPEWSYFAPVGGYVAAIALRAAGHVVPAGHRPVTISGQFLARADYGPISIEASPVKMGSSSCVEVRLSQAGRTFFQAQVWTTSRSEGPSRADAQAPPVPAVSEVRCLSEMPDLAEMIAPKVWRFFEVRPVTLMDAQEARVQLWLRFKDCKASADPFLNAARTVMLIDMLPWNAHLRPVRNAVSYLGVSLDLSVWFHAPHQTDGWLLADAHTDTVGGGLIFGGARVWSSSGDLLATGAGQLLALERGPA